MEPLLVSVIIPTRNSGATLERCLHSIMGQTYTRLEVIVIDNKSTDETLEVAKRFGVKLIQAGGERSEQTNIGAKSAQGEYLYRTDGDFVFDPDLISDAVNMVGQGFDAVVVNGTSDDSVSPWAKVRKVERDSYGHDWLRTAASFFRRDVFLELGGFNESITAGEDYDLHNRLVRAGYQVGKIDSRAIHLGEPLHLSEVVHKYIYYGSVIDSFLQENPGKGNWQISPVRWVIIKNIPKFRLGFFRFLVYHYAKYVAALIGWLS
jgi:glycosyltransferase involved in cell wall biosynthesis